MYPDYPPHRRAVEIEVELGRGDAEATVLGTDLTHECKAMALFFACSRACRVANVVKHCDTDVTINGDYRS